MVLVEDVEVEVLDVRLVLVDVDVLEEVVEEVVVDVLEVLEVLVLVLVPAKGSKATLF